MWVECTLYSLMNTFSVQSQSAAELIYIILGCIIVNGLGMQEFTM